eukprot:10356611-Lingulodinium_polyedra.AAC.1
MHLTTAYSLTTDLPLDDLVCQRDYSLLCPQGGLHASPAVRLPTSDTVCVGRMCRSGRCRDVSA